MYRRAFNPLFALFHANHTKFKQVLTFSALWIQLLIWYLPLKLQDMNHVQSRHSFIFFSCGPCLCLLTHYEQLLLSVFGEDVCLLSVAVKLEEELLPCRFDLLWSQIVAEDFSMYLYKWPLCVEVSLVWHPCQQLACFVLQQSAHPCCYPPSIKTGDPHWVPRVETY